MAREYGDVRVRVFSSADHALRCAADRIVDLIAEPAAQARGATLGLPTGRTPIGMYRELVARHRAGISFAGVTTFNLDEYHPIARDAAGSFRHFMREHFHDHVDIPPRQIHIPDGSLPAERVAAHCREYEQAIRASGGIDLQVLGIGSNGHIGFNEPASPRDSRTRLVELHGQTRLDNAAAFGGPELVPRHAITMGIGTILEGRALLVLAFGAAKAAAMRAALLGPIDESVPASLLRTHRQIEFLLDPAAAAGLDTGGGAVSA